MGRVIIYPFKMECEGSIELRDAIRNLGLECIRVYPDGKYVPQKSDLIIDWGCSRIPSWKPSGEVLNHWNYIPVAIDKRESFIQFAQDRVDIPAFTLSFPLAQTWIAKDIPVVQRTTVTSSKGKGASVVRKAEQLNESCKLFVTFIDKKQEFRIHVFNGNIIDYHEKIYKGKGKVPDIMSSPEDMQGGDWEWTRKTFVPANAKIAAIRAVKSLYLNFGGVDVITDQKGNSFVLEVNTAPWLGSICAKRYANAIKEYQG